MIEEEITFRALTKEELEDLKEIYLSNKIDGMNMKELQTFVRDVLEHQVKSTVGDEEEKEVWEEMKLFFKNDFSEIITTIKKENLESKDNKKNNPDKLKQDIKTIIERNKNSKEIEDMWEDD
tara:strand:+ start:1535 stop:1900 length:366 start_codon:yes stop_codon:yes gene_type:complete